MKRFLIVAVAVGMAACAEAGTCTWRGGDGSWNDPNMWKGGVPGEGDIVYFPDGVGGRVTITGECVGGQLLIGKQNVVSEEDAPVVFCGGGTLTTAGSTAHVYPGGRLIIENATLKTGTGAEVSIDAISSGGAVVEVCSGGLFDCSATRMRVYSGATLFVDGGEARGNLTLDGTFRMTSGIYRFTQKAQDSDLGIGHTIDITGGTVIYGEEMRAGHVINSARVGFFPRTPSSSLVVNVTAGSDEGFSVNLENSPDGAVYKLAGTVSLTNYATSANLGTFASTSNMVFYGGGTLAANWVCNRKGTDFDFGLSRVLLGSGLRSGSTFSDYRFHGDVVFGAYADWRWGSNNKSILSLDGDATFDTDDCFDGGVTSHTLKIPPILFVGSSASATFTGGGDVECRFNKVPVAPATIRALRFVDGMDVAFTDLAAATPSYFVRDFIAGANAQYTIPAKVVSSISNVNFTCLNKTVLPSSTHFTAIYEAASANPNLARSTQCSRLRRAETGLIRRTGRSCAQMQIQGWKAPMRCVSWDRPCI